MSVSWRIMNGLVYLESDEATTFEEWRAAVDAARFGRTRWALLVDNSVGYGMGRMAETLTGSGAALRVFRDPAEAETWARGEGT